MSYQVLARKWRPQTFAEVVGQEHIARTLKNALNTGRTGHAYLFVGSRGIGKTTSARIFAKALNCQHRVDGEPCCQCESCREIAEGSSMDVIEIDAASHNKVEHIQPIREQMAFPPVKSPFKIYIMDEVHMLTPSAWNALLKTLEEPPPYIKFIFATTEVHKVLPTIISRCQRFDLRRIPVPLIVNRLREIANAEKLYVEDQALAAVARAANGGMRDALSTLDQIISFCGGTTPEETIRESDVIQIFGLASGTEIREIAQGILFNDLSRSLEMIGELADSGRDLEQVYDALTEFLRNLMLSGSCKDAAKYLELVPEEIQYFQQLARSVDPALPRRLLATIIPQERSFKQCLNKRMALEVLVTQLVNEIHSTSLDDILTHLNVISGLIPKEKVTPRVPPTLTTPPPVLQAPPPAPKPAPTPVAAKTPKPAPVAAETPKPTPEPPKPTVAEPPKAEVKPEPATAPDPAPAPVVAETPTPVPVAEAPAPTSAPAPVAQEDSPMEIPPALLNGEGVESYDSPAEASDKWDWQNASVSSTTAEEGVSAGVQALLSQDSPREEYQAIAGTNYRRATKEELKALSERPAVKQVSASLGTQPYDGVIPL